MSAIGNPKDTIVPIGAVREYVPDESWKQVVENLMQKATLIVAGAGTSHGLEWELETVKSLQLLHKTVLLFPPSLADDDGFLQRVLSLLQVSQIVDTPADLEDLSETLEPRNPARRAARNQARQLRYSVGLVFPSGGAPVLLKAQHLSEVEYELALKLLAHTCCASP